MRKIVLVCFVLVSISSSVSGQTIQLPELGGYKKVSNYPVFAPENLWDFINGAADTYLAYGFVDLQVAEYKKGKNVIKLELYQHSDNTMAFGIYSSERSPTFRFINLGSQGYDAGGAINFFKGKYYVKIRCYSKNEKVLQSAELLANKVSDMIPGDSKMPAVLSLFPAENKLANEETYINESVLGHKFLSKAYKAIYQIGSDNFSVFIQGNSSTEESLKSANAYLVATGVDPDESASGKYVLTDGYNGTIFLAWKDKVLVIISGLAKDQTDLADRYTSEILK